MCRISHRGISQQYIEDLLKANPRTGFRLSAIYDTWQSPRPHSDLFQEKDLILHHPEIASQGNHENTMHAKEERVPIVAPRVPFRRPLGPMSVPLSPLLLTDHVNAGSVNKSGTMSYSSSTIMMSTRGELDDTDDTAGKSSVFTPSSPTIDNSEVYVLSDYEQYIEMNSPETTGEFIVKEPIISSTQADMSATYIDPCTLRSMSLTPLLNPKQDQQSSYTDLLARDTQTQDYSYETLQPLEPEGKLTCSDRKNESKMFKLFRRLLGQERNTTQCTGRKVQAKKLNATFSMLIKNSLNFPCSKHL